jgi:16S rRNA (guanine527-N7)-methyltransferase
MPLAQFCLVEASGRKAAFLRHAAGTLGLKNVEVISERAEILARLPAYREAFDRAISRAAARPAVLLELALPLVKKGGDLLAQVGQVDLESLARVAALLGGDRPTYVSVDGHGLLCVYKARATPAEYPRRSGLPNRRPLT